MTDQQPLLDSGVRRAALPEVMFASDIALALGLAQTLADQAARQGLFGPEFYVGGRVAVLREDFLEFLTLRASRRDLESKELLPALRLLKGVHNGA